MLDERYHRGSAWPSDADATREVIDGLLVGDQEVWLIVARRGEDLSEWLEPPDGESEPAPLRICRAVLGDDTLVMGEPDPEQDALLSELDGTY